MPLPKELIEARELAKRACALASVGFCHMLEAEPPRADSVNAFAAMVEAFGTIDNGFKEIAQEKGN